MYSFLKCSNMFLFYNFNLFNYFDSIWTYTFFFFIAFFSVKQLSCIGQISIGCILLWDHFSLNDLVENGFWKPAATVICIGFMMLLVCWLGWNSTRKKNRCNLMMVGVFFCLNNNNYRLNLFPSIVLHPPLSFRLCSSLRMLLGAHFTIGAPQDWLGTN